MNDYAGFIELDAASPASSKPISTLKPSPFTGRDFGTLWFDDIELDPEAEWLISGVLPDKGLSTLWGDPGSGKSFLALDMALAVASGCDWFGKACVKGGVAYIAAEGGRGVKKRLVAYRNRFDVPRGLPFALIPAAVDLCTEDHETDALIAELQEVAGAMSEPLRLVVIDTLSRAMAGGNENDSQDMGALIRNADRIREMTGAHVLFVHHGGKDRDKKTRGHSSLFGALDCAIEVTVNEISGLRTAKIRKQKDGEDGACFTFKLDVVELAHSSDDLVTSCVVRPEEADSDPGDNGQRRLTGINAIALEALRKAVADHGHVPPSSPNIPPHMPAISPELWRLTFYQVRGGEAPETNKKAFQRARTDLQTRGLIGCWGEFTWPI